MQGLGEVAERLRRSCVRVVSGGGPASGTGSGVIWSADGTVVTNSHVVRGGSSWIELWDGRRVSAELVKRSNFRDLAQMRVKAENLVAAPLRRNAKLRPGEIVVAVGNPLGFQGAASTGVLHAVGPVPGLGKTPWIQADVMLAPGNSGGPLADAEGSVIGINTMVVAGRLGLAIPIPDVLRFLTDPEPKRLGITARPVEIRGAERGVLILGVEADSPAARASLLPGDILTGSSGRPLTSLEDLAESLETATDLIRVQFLRSDLKKSRDVCIRFSNNGVTEAR